MIKVIIGLGNPGPRFLKTRHNIGFRVLDALVEKHHGSWKNQGNQEIAKISLDGHEVVCIKPQTFMNNSGEVLPPLSKQGVKPEHIVVVHDELELPFGSIKTKVGGSAKGHNGLKSIISYVGDAFHRLRVGISRPDNRDDVPDYVLKPFSESATDVEQVIEQAVAILEEYCSHIA